MVSCHWSLLHLARLAIWELWEGRHSSAATATATAITVYRSACRCRCLTSAYPNEPAACFHFPVILCCFCLLSVIGVFPSMEHWHGNQRGHHPAPLTGLSDLLAPDFHSIQHAPSSGSRCPIGTPLFHLPAVLPAHLTRYIRRTYSCFCRPGIIFLGAILDTNLAVTLRILRKSVFRSRVHQAPADRVDKWPHGLLCIKRNLAQRGNAPHMWGKPQVWWLLWTFGTPRRDDRRCSVCFS